MIRAESVNDQVVLPCSVRRLARRQIHGALPSCTRPVAVTIGPGHRHRHCCWLLLLRVRVSRRLKLTDRIAGANAARAPALCRSLHATAEARSARCARERRLGERAAVWAQTSHRAAVWAQTRRRAAVWAGGGAGLTGAQGVGERVAGRGGASQQRDLPHSYGQRTWLRMEVASLM